VRDVPDRKELVGKPALGHTAKPTPARRAPLASRAAGRQAARVAALEGGRERARAPAEARRRLDPAHELRLDPASARRAALQRPGEVAEAHARPAGGIAQRP